MKPVRHGAGASFVADLMRARPAPLRAQIAAPKANVARRRAKRTTARSRKKMPTRQECPHQGLLCSPRRHEPVLSYRRLQLCQANGPQSTTRGQKLDTFRPDALRCTPPPGFCCDVSNELAVNYSKLIPGQTDLPVNSGTRRLLRAICAVGGIGFWLTGPTAADAAVVCGSAIRGAAMGAALPTSQQPLAPRGCQRRQESLLHVLMNHAGGAGSQGPTHGPNPWPPAALDVKTHEAGQGSASRLAFSQRAVLPAPLRDRFFRPPRLYVA